ncbi:prolactin regulatory element-binding protein [Platysternon megacephalum]|uniref:Prolactin regulatory element-binding protein n=1 Tax=Platysternon megacephalum TaxID=55544 RepID=A0A4D9DRA4_9SAUR|nr:prolactin regulatory element-binding protein [Platysternon megacephalum]
MGFSHSQAFHSHDDDAPRRSLLQPRRLGQAPFLQYEGDDGSRHQEEQDQGAASGPDGEGHDRPCNVERDMVTAVCKAACGTAGPALVTEQLPCSRDPCELPEA